VPFTPNATPVFPYQPQNLKVKILNATGTTLVTGYTAGANGSKITGIIATSTDTVARDIQVFITNGGTDYLLGTKNVAISSGNVNGTPSTNILDPAVIPGLPIDSDGNPFLYLISGDVLKFASLTTVTTALSVTLTTFAADF
jgi:hypothetical protein